VWQVPHWPATSIWVWFHFVGRHAVTLWQLVQLAAPTGTWVADLAVAVLPLWQLVQSVDAVNMPWSTLDTDQFVADLWQLSHVVTPLWIGVFGLPTAGAKPPV
jgi:hypothetical protein